MEKEYLEFMTELYECLFEGEDWTVVQKSKTSDHMTAKHLVRWFTYDFFYPELSEVRLANLERILFGKSVNPSSGDGNRIKNSKEVVEAQLKDTRLYKKLEHYIQLNQSRWKL